MHIKASQIRQLAVSLDKEISMKVIFPAAYRWEKLTEERVRFKAHSFAGNEFGIDVYDGNDLVGVWRPGKGDEQEFIGGDFMYQVIGNTKTASLSVYRCKE